MTLRIETSTLAGALLATTLVIVVGAIDPARATSLPGKIDEVHTRFNAEAREFGFHQRMVLLECLEVTCNYSITGELGVIANVSPQDPAKLGSLLLIFGKGSDGASMLMSMGTLITVYSPELEAEERGAAIRELSNTITQKRTTSQVTIGDINYSLQNLGSMGLWFTVKPQ